MIDNDTATAWLDASLPAPLRGVLEPDIASLDGRAGALDWTAVDVHATDRTCELSLSADGVVADVTAIRVPDHDALVVTTTVEGTDGEPPVAWDTFQPVQLNWERRGGMIARTSRGGGAEKYYPPLSWTEETRRGNFESGVIHDSSIEIGSARYGRSSGEHAPVMLSGTADGGVVAAMEWSGRWKQRLGYSRDGDRHVHEVSVPLSGLALEPGERVSLPPTHLVCYEGDADDGGNAFRRYVYEEICPPLDGERPLPAPHYNHWFGYGNEISAEALAPQVDAAADLGLSYFMLDAGWFPGGFPYGVGNWRVDREKFPDGLDPFAEYVRSKGLGMGLWFDFERAHVDSDVYAEHPEWFVALDEPPDLPDKGHLSSSVPSVEFAHLDLSIDDAREWAVDLVSGWIDRLGLSWVKFDYNIEPVPYWEATGSPDRRMFGHVEGLYAVLDELLDRHPDVLIENCASGGRRHDLGTLRRAHTSWISDMSENAHVCRYMQSGANRFFPGNLLNSAVVEVASEGSGFQPDGTDEGDAPIDVEVASRMLGTLCFMGDIAGWPAARADRVSELVEWYREWRSILVEEFYPLTPSPRRADRPEVVQFASRDRDRALVAGFVAEGTAELRLSLQGLAASRTYEVADPWGDAADLATGDALMDDGLSMTIHEDAPLVRTLVATGD